MVVETTLLIGVVGGSMVLLVFVLSSLEKLSRGNYTYMALNGLGALLLVYYAILSNVIVFAILNAIWGSVEIYYLIKKLTKR